MATNYKARIGDEIKLRVNTTIDISDALAVAIDWKDPTGNTGSWVGVINSPYVEYDLGPSDLSIDGTWTIQSFVEKADGKKVHGDPVKFSVGPLAAGIGHTHS